MGNRSKRQNPNTVATRQTTISQSYSGPLPLASEMERYAQIDPTFPDRIITLAEKQSAHRQELERLSLFAADQQRRRGTYCAFILTIVAIIGGVYCISSGYSTEGLVSIIASIGILAGTFIYGVHSNKKERLEKWRQIEPKGKNQND